MIHKFYLHLEQKRFNYLQLSKAKWQIWSSMGYLRRFILQEAVDFILKRDFNSTIIIAIVIVVCKTMHKGINEGTFLLISNRSLY